MPPSADQESNNIANGNTQLGKVTQRASTAAHIPTKNGRKNGTAKDTGGGGVMAAVTKNKANAKSTIQPLRVQSPEMKPASSPPNDVSVAAPSNGNPVTSPLLDALSSASFGCSPSQNTNEWARSVPAFSTSPNNLINLGESPPTFPSSYEDRSTHLGWAPREQRGIPGGVSPSSPPGRRRPLSYQLDGNFRKGVEEYNSQVLSYAARRSSMYSQHPRYGPHPPLPHQAQPHFYGAPDANLLTPPPGPGLVPGDWGYYCGFGSLSMTQDGSKPADNVVITGYEGGFNVHAVTKRGLNKIAGIEGIRGGIYNAKILPWRTEGEHSHQFPLIVLVVHGPAWTSSEDSGGENVTILEGEAVNQTERLRGSPRNLTESLHDADTDEQYQTTVEVYSLSTKQHVATLLSIPRTSFVLPSASPLFRAPAPLGSLTILADGGNIIIASGTTGETWIFRQASLNTPVKFKCLGKVWTAVQRGVTIESTISKGMSDNEWLPNDHVSARKHYNASILALNGRWLAFCPPSPTSQISLRAAIPSATSTSRVPGLNTHASPQLPTVNCAVDTPGGESMVQQLMQAGTQQIIKGATYLGGKGVQAWNNYWNKPIPNQQPNGGASYQAHPNLAHHFPPTHGAPTTTPVVNRDPGLISILDLESLSHTASTAAALPHPLATFKVPHGCSFLSFAPNGLALFTASSKGDVQFVWDLLRIQYAKSSLLKGGIQSAGAQGPHVRQIAQFSRMTIARIVDVVWTSPHGERAAMVTEPGTVHILDIPASAFTWPPLRRRIASPQPVNGKGEVANSAITAASGVASSAVSSLWTAARPLVSRRRRSSGGMSAMTAQAGHGTQALAAGISRSVGAATGRMNEMRKSGNTKLHLPHSTTIPSKACILLLSGKKHDSVIVSGGGIIRFYTIKNRRADRPVDKQKASRGAKHVEFRLPSLPDGINQTVGDLEFTKLATDDSRFPARVSPAPKIRVHGTDSSIPQAEIESNAPYQPFHTDRRVGLHVYSYQEETIPSPSVSVLLSPIQVAKDKKSTLSPKATSAWAFGGLINSTKLDVGPPHNPDDDSDSTVDFRALPSSSIERVMRITDSNENIEQIVVTTRRRKGAGRAGVENPGAVDEEGFFEDDCEVLDFASQRV